MMVLVELAMLKWSTSVDGGKRTWNQVGDEPETSEQIGYDQNFLDLVESIAEKGKKLTTSRDSGKPFLFSLFFQVDENDDDEVS